MKLLDLPALSGATIDEVVSSVPVRTNESLPEAFDRAARDDGAHARSSLRVLLLFSGPTSRPDGLAAFLSQLGFETVQIDADSEHGGGAEHDVLNDDVFQKLLARVKAAEFCAIIAAPPCSTFSISRFITPPKGKEGAPPVRSRKHIRGLPQVPDGHRRELVRANAIVAA